MDILGLGLRFYSRPNGRSKDDTEALLSVIKKSELRAIVFLLSGQHIVTPRRVVLERKLSIDALKT